MSDFTMDCQNNECQYDVNATTMFEDSVKNTIDSGISIGFSECFVNNDVSFCGGNVTNISMTNIEPSISVNESNSDSYLQVAETDQVFSI